MEGKVGKTERVPLSEEEGGTVIQNKKKEETIRIFKMS